MGIFGIFGGKAKAAATAPNSPQGSPNVVEGESAIWNPSAAEQNLAPQSPAPGSAEASAKRLEDLKTAAAVVKEGAMQGPGPADSGQIAHLESEVKAKGIDPATITSRIQPEFKPAPSPMESARFTEGQTPVPTPESQKSTPDLVNQLNSEVAAATAQPTPIRPEPAAPVASDVKKAA